MSLGVNRDAANMQFLASYKNRYGINYAGVNATNTVNYQANNYQQLVSERGNACTDGKNDGKIGLFGAAGNIIEGVAKGALNTAKGMFFDENGFSIGRTLKTVAIGALCCACPAVGLGLSAVGLAAGGIKVAKSIVKASGAKTDAEAKDAFEELGEGGLTVGLSALGAKASYKAIQTRAANLGSSELNNLGEDFNPLENADSFKQWGKALWEDSKNTTVNGLKEAKTGIVEQFKADRELNAANKALTKAQKAAKANTESISTETNIESAKSALDAAQSNYNQTTMGKIKNLEIVKNASQTAKHPFKFIGKTAKDGFSAVAKAFRGLKENGVSEVSKSAILKLGANGKAILNALTDGKKDFNQLVAEYGYSDVTKVLAVLGTYGNLDKTI